MAVMPKIINSRSIKRRRNSRSEQGRKMARIRWDRENARRAMYFFGWLVQFSMKQGANFQHFSVTDVITLYDQEQTNQTKCQPTNNALPCPAQPSD